MGKWGQVNVAGSKGGKGAGEGRGYGVNVGRVFC